MAISLKAQISGYNITAAFCEKRWNKCILVAHYITLLNTLTHIQVHRAAICDINYCLFFLLLMNSSVGYFIFFTLITSLSVILIFDIYFVKLPQC